MALDSGTTTYELAKLLHTVPNLTVITNDLRISAGVLRVSAIQLTLVTDSAEKVYDGRALRADGFTLTKGALARGQSIAAYQIKGSQTNVGVSDAVVTDIVILDADGRNVTANYQITIIPGTLRVLAP